MNTVRVEEVESRKDLRAFLLFPWRVYEGEACWVPPMISEVKERLDRAGNFFSTCPSAEKFIKNIAFVRKRSPEAGAEDGKFYSQWRRGHGF